jgi:Rieske 2Fe-2S family protein
MSVFLSSAEIGTGGATTLPGRFYTAPAIFQLEHERVFYERWLCVGREEQIREPGRFFVRGIGTESILVLRDAEGAVQAFHNLCRHRGSRLCTEAQGRFTRTIQCPYHAWTYGLDGRLLGAPGMDGASGFNREGFALHPVAVALWEGFVFASLARSPEPFDRAFAALRDRFTRYRLPTLRTERRIDYDVRANWKLIFENYSECYHCPTVHPALTKLSPAESGRNDLTRGPFLGGYMTLHRAGGSLTRSGAACAPSVGDLCDEDRQHVYYYSIFPNMLLSLHHDYVLVHTIWPTAPDRTLIECSWLFHPSAAQFVGFDPDDGIAFWDTTNRQDWQICELSQQGIASRAYSPGPYSPRESLSAAFDRELLDALNLEPTIEP